MFKYILFWDEALAVALSVDECSSLEMCPLNYDVLHTMSVLALLSKSLYNTTPVHWRPAMKLSSMTPGGHLDVLLNKDLNLEQDNKWGVPSPRGESESHQQRLHPFYWLHTCLFCYL